MAPPFDHLRIYATEMSTYVDGGYPLWCPEVTPTEGEVQIGDVGYVRKGAFIRLFNINTSQPEHGVGDYWKPAFDVTDHLPAAVFRLDRRQGHVEPGHYPSHGLRRREIRGSLS